MNQVRFSAWLPLPVPQPGHSAGKAEPNEPPQSKEKFVEGLEPVIWGLQLLEDLFIYLFRSDRCGAVQEMCSCNCCVEICVFLNFRLQCKRNHREPVSQRDLGKKKNLNASLGGKC